MKKHEQFWLGVGIGLLMIIAFNTCDANAESAIVSFNDAEHLVVLTDSVVGVRDTVSEIHCWYLDGDTTATHFWDVFTNRELICVAVVKDFKLRMVDRRGILLQVGSPDTAIINYRRVKQ